MALRKWHLFWGALAYFVYIVAYWYIVEEVQIVTGPVIDIIWATTGLLLCLLGAEMADYDQLTSLLSHRDIMTHSGLIPTLIFLPFFLTKLLNGLPNIDSMNYALAFTPFMIGYGTHLILDLFPTIDPEKTMKKKGVAHASIQLFGTAIQGVTSAEIISRVSGTYLIHLPMRLPVVEDGSSQKLGTIRNRKTLPKHWTRWWLFFSGIYCFILAFLTINLYIEIIPILAF